MSISNLAGVPSIVFGLLGYTLFVGAAGLGNSVLAAALTMSLLILPVIIVASQKLSEQFLVQSEKHHMVLVLINGKQLEELFYRQHYLVF